MGLFLASIWTGGAVSGIQLSLSNRLQEPVTDFDNGQKPLIQTLFIVARKYNLPMGIEKVDRSALQKPIVVQLEQGTVKQLLDACISEVSGYAWVEQSETINVFGINEFSSPKNLLNTVIPHFEVNDESLPTANYKLRNVLEGLWLSQRHKQTNPQGMIGSYPFNPSHVDARVTINIDRATVREILNQMVSPFRGAFIWITRVTPEHLSLLPKAGLWQIVGSETEDPTSLLDLGAP